ncbi:MAG: TldD/PmbA family protein [Acidobacteria bacterium]|nr:TldD/PmbA family protein [Acidobacteriota bacterium]
MSAPLGPDRLADAAAAALSGGADGLLATIFHTWGGLTRFADSQVHQNTWQEDVETRVVAVVDDRRVGCANTHSLGHDAVGRAAADAVAIARAAPPDPDFPGLAPPATPAEKDAYDEATAAAPPSERTAAVARVLAVLPPGIGAAGFVETGGTEVLLASTTGLRVYARSTSASMSVLASAEDSSGFAEVAERRLSDLDPEALAGRAARKAELGRDPRPIEAGEYTVVLEPAATATLIQFLAFLGFGAKAYLEGRSFLSGRLGDTVCSDLVTITDDALAADALGLPFDFEGTPARRVPIIERGVARDVVWDRTTAAKAGRSSTGHALPPPNPEGPLPLNIRMEPGDTPVEQLIASTARGLLVTRFHYSNVVSEKETVLTGMTRDGTFAIEDGRLAHGVRNLRYTQNALAALGAVEAVGDRTEISTELFFGGSRAPALKIARFNFSSATTY